MFTRSTLSLIVAAGLLSGGMRPAAANAPVTSLDDVSPSVAVASATQAQISTVDAATVNTDAQVTSGSATAVAATASTPAAVTSTGSTSAATTGTATGSTSAATAGTSTGSASAATAGASTGTTSTAAADASTESTPATTAGTSTEATSAATEGSSAETANAPAPAAPPVEVLTPPVIPTVTTSTVKPADPNPQAQVDVYHALSITDDGSAIMLTVDGSDAGELKRGKVTTLTMSPGKHKLGGYVRTLFGMGRVTIPAVEINTTVKGITKVSYRVTKDKPGFYKG